MGKDKALLPFPGSQAVTFVEHLASVLVACCTEVVTVARDQAHAAGYSLPGMRIAYDKVPDYGPLMGLSSGLGGRKSDQVPALLGGISLCPAPLLSSPA